MAGAALFASMLFFVATHTGELRLQWSAMRPAYALLSLALLIASYVAFMAGWRYLAEHAGLHATTTDHAVHWSLSLLGKYVPGKIWQGVGRLSLYGQSARWGAGAVAMVVEAGMQLAVGSTIAGVLLLLGVPRVPGWMPAVSLAVGIGAFVCLTARPVRDLLAPLVRWIGAGALWAPLSPRVLGTLAACHSVAYAAMILGYLAIVRAAGFDALAMAPALAGGLLFGGALGMLAFLVPAGLGVRDGTIAWVLTGWVPAPDAILLAVLSRVWLVAGEVVIVAAAGLVMALHRHRRRNGRESQPKTATRVRRD